MLIEEKRDGIYSFMMHLGPFGCIKTALFSETAISSKTAFQEKKQSDNYADHQVQILIGFAIFQLP